MKNLVNVNYISYWDCGEVKSNAKVNIITGEVVDIETVEVDDRYENCEGEFVEYQDGSMEQVIVRNNGSYFTVSKSGEEFKVIKIHDTKYTVLEEIDKKEIHRICGVAY